MKQAFWANPWFTIPALVFINAGLLLALFLPPGMEILHLNDWRREPLNTFFRWATRLGEVWPFLAIGLLSLLWRYRIAVLLAMGGLLIFTSSQLLKVTVSKDRPMLFFANHGLTERVVLAGEWPHGGRTSFPSGHTMTAFGLFGVLALLAGRRRPALSLACAGAAALVGVSRIFLIQHFLTDVVAGALLGLLAAGVIWAIDQRWLSQYTVLDSGILNRHRSSPPAPQPPAVS
ncbi:MAG: phosphatase PAP2 family protein [Saprospiraceae bacterium]|nr:phosphatase PAP2 family protein [Saprospiraceae bacterium]MDW8229425.1 phosphatase PAP2 family protein [Saprospiraceae bacterium]